MGIRRILHRRPGETERLFAIAPPIRKDNAMMAHEQAYAKLKASEIWDGPIHGNIDGVIKAIDANPGDG